MGNWLNKTGLTQLKDILSTKFATKVDKHPGITAGKFLQTDSNGDAIWGEAASASAVASATTTWLENNVSGGQTIAVDRSLTISGAAADAKAAGDLRSTTSEITGLVDISEDGWSSIRQYIKTDTATADISSPVTVSSGNVRYIVIPCQAGDVFTVKAQGTIGARAWAFVGSGSPGTVLDVANQNANEVNRMLIAPANSAYLVINDTSLAGKVYRGTINLEKKINNISEKAAMIADIPDKIRANNLLAPILEENMITNGQIVAQTVYYSGVHISGTVPNNSNKFVTRRGFSLKSGTTYTLFVDGSDTLNMQFLFGYNTQNVVKVNNVNFSFRANSGENSYSFTPDRAYSNLGIIVYQSTGNDLPVSGTYRMCLVEGQYSLSDFSIRKMISSETTSALTSMVQFHDTVRNGNLLNDILPFEATYGSLHVVSSVYSKLMINGTLESGIPRRITNAGISVEAGYTYTCYIKGDPDSKFVFGIATNEQNYIKQDGINITWRSSGERVYKFIPDSSATAMLVAYQDSEEDLLLDTELCVIIVKGSFEITDFKDISFEADKFEESKPINSLTVGLSILRLTGSLDGISKDDAVTLGWKYKGENGSCTLKWQGSSSINYAKKNFTIKFDKGLDLGWGEQKKYVLKANYIDNTNALNICTAKLWAQIVGQRGTHPAIQVAANAGAMDGYPVMVELNGLFYGLYTLTTPKDPWTFGMGENNTEYLVTAEAHSNATRFSNLAEMDGTDFELEYAADGVEPTIVKTSLNQMIYAIIHCNQSQWEEDVNPYMDVDTAIDYMIFSALVSNVDGLDKNYILSSYDGTKWYFNAYDLDSVFGNEWDGSGYYTPSITSTSIEGIKNNGTLYWLIYNKSKNKLISRYDQIRETVMNETNIMNLFYNFCRPIPKSVIDQDNLIWPTKPGTDTDTLSRIMEWVRLRFAFIDSQIDALRNN